MKNFGWITFSAILCLLFSSLTVEAQVSRKQTEKQGPVVVEKDRRQGRTSDRNEDTEVRRRPSTRQTSTTGSRKSPQQSRTDRTNDRRDDDRYGNRRGRTSDRRTYPGRNDDVRTDRYPERRRERDDDRYENRRERNNQCEGRSTKQDKYGQKGKYGKKNKSGKTSKAKCGVPNCQHPGKHVGLHRLEDEVRALLFKPGKKG